MGTVERLRGSVHTREDLWRRGIGPTRLEAMLREGALTRLRTGAYVSTQLLSSVRHESRLLLEAIGYQKVAAREPIFLRRTAAVLHGLQLGRVPDDVEIAAAGRCGSEAAGVRSREISPASRRRAVVRSGAQVTGLVDTLVDCARFTVPGGGAADHRERPAPGADRSDRRRRCRGAAPAAGPGAAGLHRPGQPSGGEHRGGDEPVLRVHRREPVPDALPPPRAADADAAAGHRPYRVDFAWPQQRVIVEFDGMGKYGDTQTAGGIFLAEKRREAWLQSQGWTVLRLTWDKLSRPWEIVDRLARVGVLPRP